MDDANRQFAVSYQDTSLRDETVDVSFELSEEAEEALFAGFEREISEHIRDGTFPAQKLHLFHRLTEQRSEHMPWFENDMGVRTYDLTLSEWDYHLLTRIIGNSMSNVLGPDAADRYEELVDVWKDITEQLQLANELQDLEAELAEEFPVNGGGEFRCFVKDGQFRLYEDEEENTWYVCCDCEETMTDIMDHDCA